MLVFAKVFYDPHFLYFRWLAGLVWIVEFVIAIKYYKLILKNIKTIILISLGSLAISIPWDFFAIRNGIWYFPNSLIGTWILGIPLEEYMFFLSVALLVVIVTIVFAEKESK